MGEITDIVYFYLKDCGVFEEKVKEIQLYLEEQMKLTLNEGMNSYRPKYLDLPPAQQYQRTGHTADSIRTEYTIDDLEGLVRGYLSPGYPEYTVYVDENSIWGGYHFFQGGLEKVMELYG